MNEECLVCKAPLVYLNEDEPMECVLCHKTELSKTRCENGHYICTDCHTKGLDTILGVCLSENSRDPIFILKKLMKLPFCHMHGPEHHVMVGAALLTACHNAGADFDLVKALAEMQSRGHQIPGGACGFWGACGAGISSGIAVSILSGSTPLKEREWGLSNRMTALSLSRIGEIGGPRCCKRDSFLSVLAAVEFLRDNFGIALESAPTPCEFYPLNNQCIKERCPFHPL